MRKFVNITIIGLGPAGLGLVTLDDARILRSAERLILRTERHPAAVELAAEGVKFRSLDPLYNESRSFTELYPRLAEAVLEAAVEGHVVYAVPGHPLLGEESVRLILEAARERGLSVRVGAGMSFLDVVASALVAAGETPNLTEWQVADGAALERIWWETSRPVVIFQVDDAAAASRVKLALLEEYPTDFEVCIIRRAGQPGREQARRVPLEELDRAAAGRYDHLTTLYVPSLPPDRKRPGFPEFVQLIATLRGPNGCPWDREQSYQSLKRFVLEEAYEVLEAVDSEDPDRLADELGDLMLQVLLYSQIASEAGDFDLRDVMANIVQKLIRRHPHVFGDIQVADAAGVVTNWEAIKRTEKPERQSVLDGVPKDLPALMKALDVSKRVVRVGFEWPDLDAVLAKVEEELRELRAELPGGDRKRLGEELGDLLFTLVNVSRWLKIDPEEALRQMVERFSRRFREVERLAAASGKPIETLGLAELDRLWDIAKQQV